MADARVVGTRSDLRRNFVTLAAVLAVLGLLTGLTAPAFIPRVYFLRQDSLVLGALVLLLVGYGFRAFEIPPARRFHLELTARKVVLAALLMALLLWAATYLLFDNYPLSRDEQMVIFDTQVLKQGRLALPLAPEWRHYAEALTPAFLLPLPGNAAWVSSYMPGNAMLRTLFGAIADQALMNPLLAAAGAVATFDCARRLFPGRTGAQAIALLMYATSAQLLITQLTPYAMTAHLALNMLWLSFYLRGTRWGHAAAIALGFVGIGLHQVIFHPLFALPFIEHLRRRGQSRTALAYLACYAAFGLFWISYPNLVAISAGLSSQSGSAAGSGGFIADRVLPLLMNREPQTIPLMEANLLRFIAWQNLAVLPLMTLGWAAVRRNDGVARPLMAGIILTFAAMAFLLPYQAMGPGYRYLHGFVGSCALLAGYGWRDFADRAAVRSLVLVATAVTVFGSIPFLSWRSHQFEAPYARANRAIDKIDADMIVVDTGGPYFRIDEVRNRADLSNRPIRLAGHLLTPADIATLCGRGTIAFVDAQWMQGFGVGPGDSAVSPWFPALEAAAPEQCLRGAGSPAMR